MFLDVDSEFLYLIFCKHLQFVQEAFKSMPYKAILINMHAYDSDTRDYVKGHQHRDLKIHIFKVLAV